MTWDTLNFTEFTTPPSIPGTAVHSLSITNITDLQAAIQDTSVDVVNWDGIYSDNTVIVDQLANIAVDKTLYITGTGDLPPLKIINGSADRSLVIMDMTFGGDQPAGNRRINMINAENVTLYNLDRSWQGQANNFIVMGNTRGQVTRNIKIHRGRWIGTQSSPNELAAVLYASDCPTLDRDDYNANGAWPGEFDGIEIYDVHSTEVSDFVQLQMTDGNVRHYTDKDYKNLHVKGCLIESPAGLSEDAFDVKGTSKLWENRAIIEHCIMRGYRAVSGGGAGANGAAISGHTT
ncbi:MAG: hypothetical protein GY938_04065, partial [Ketobacter sp.]|nr:hypothetical protein [Ketobacter sp.]